VRELDAKAESMDSKNQWLKFKHPQPQELTFFYVIKCLNYIYKRFAQQILPAIKTQKMIPSH